MRRKLIVAGAVLLVPLVLAACGSEPAGGGVATAGNGSASTASASAPPADLTAVARCLRDNGIDVSDPDPGTGRLDLGSARRGDPEAFRQAMEKCRHLLPAGSLGAQLGPDDIEKLRQFAQCMREHGVDMPDPDPGAGNPFGGALGRIDRNSPAFRTAFDACKDKLPAALADRGGGS